MQAVDVVHCVGPRMRHLWQGLGPQQQGKWAERAEDMLPGLARLVGPGDVVLVKGSLGARLGQLVDALRNLGQTPGQNVRRAD